MANIRPAEHSSDPLTGHYLREGGKLTSPTTTLLLVTRKATTPAKAEVYVLRVHQDGRRSYVSSLWDGPVAGTYALEYGRQRYTLTLTDDAGIVAPAQEGNPMYNNRVSGNSIAAS